MAKLLQMSLFFAETQDELQEAASPALPEAPPSLEDAQSAPEPIQQDIPDANARKLALDIQRSWIVEAPAGSGKTGLLIQRFLRLLAYGGADDPSEILALTFTRKAGAEMRQRVLGQLSAAASNSPFRPGAPPFERATRDLALAVLARDRALGWHLLEHPRQLNIRTIDSFCAELAGSLPILAGAGGRLSPTDNPQALYELAAERTLLHMDGHDPTLTQDLRQLLLHRDARASDVVDLLGDMLKQRDQWAELVPLDAARLTDEALDAEVRPRLTRTLERLIHRELQTAANQLGHGLLTSMAHLAHELSACPVCGDGSHPFAPCTALPAPPSTQALDLPQWLCLVHLLFTKEGKWRARISGNFLGVEPTPNQKQQLTYLLAEARDRAERVPALPQTLHHLRALPSAPYPDEQWQVVKSLCRVLRQALVELQIVFAERQQCDFTEVALTARQLFHSEAAAPDLLHASTGALKHLLVDEMQDTSAGQYDLLERLTASWDGHTQTVFLVGDPKQSIYEFRQARVERFLRVMEKGRLGTLPLGSLRLSSNFRSQAGLVEAFNRIFGAILPSPEALAQDAESPDVPFVAATSTRPGSSSPATWWHAAEEPDSPTTGPTSDAAHSPYATAAQARALRDVVERFQDAWPTKAPTLHRAPRIAVLARNRSHLAPVVQEFQQDRGRGPVHYRAVDVEALGERPEILDLLSLTRALLDPTDRVAWLSVLRSPLCGLSLADLLILTGEGPHADRITPLSDLVSARFGDFSQAGQRILKRSWPVLQKAIADQGRTSLRTHVQRTWSSLGGDAPLKPHERSNAFRFLDLLEQVESGPEGLRLSLLEARLRTLYAAPSTTSDGVELMTIHKAKGLEWDLVLIPALHRGSGRNSHELLKWLEFDSEEGQADFLLAPIQGKGEAASQLSGWLNRYQTARQTAEAKRLLYVACTRAREELHLFATVKRKPGKPLETPYADSLLRAAWPVAQEIFEQQLSSASLPAEILEFPAPSPRETFALAASSEAAIDSAQTASSLPKTARLPEGFDVAAPFRSELGPGLPYPSAETFRVDALFQRPEGSFAARAFGNVVHRFLPLLAEQFARAESAVQLLSELPSWRARLHTSLRSEGLPATQAGTEADRVLKALDTILRDPEGLWLLLPHYQARDEAPLPATTDVGAPTLRADRTFLAGPTPGDKADADHLWIVDYKTAELGNRTRESFLAEQKLKYLPQMESYAATAIGAGHDPARIRLALYFPLVPALIFWPAQAGVALR